MARSGRATSSISRRRQNARTEGSEDYALRRAELIAIAGSLFREKGYARTTLADVGERAGLDRATIYYYVASKKELFESSHEGVLDEQLRFVEGLRADRELATREKLRAFITYLTRSFDASYPQASVYIQQMHRVANDPSPWAREMHQKTRRMEAATRALVQDAVERGKLRSDIDVRIATKGLFGMLNWMSRWYAPGDALSADEVAEAFCKMFFEGIQRR